MKNLIPLSQYQTHDVNLYVRIELPHTFIDCFCYQVIL